MKLLDHKHLDKDVPFFKDHVRYNGILGSIKSRLSTLDMAHTHNSHMHIHMYTQYF